MTNKKEKAVEETPETPETPETVEAPEATEEETPKVAKKKAPVAPMIPEGTVAYTKAQFKELIERYKEQNPSKYALKEEVLLKKLNSLK